MEASTGQYLIFQTADEADSGMELQDRAEHLRLALAAALACEGATIDTNMHPLESDWLFYGVREGDKFAVVLTILDLSPCTWVVFLEGESPEEEPASSIRPWANPKMEQAIAALSGVSQMQWHASHLTLPTQ